MTSVLVGVNSPKSGTTLFLNPYPPCLVVVRAHLCSDLILGFAGQRPPWTSCEYLPPSCPSQACTFPEHLSLKPIFSGIAPDHGGVVFLGFILTTSHMESWLFKEQMVLVGFPHSGSQVAHLPLFYLLQGEAGVSGLPGGIGLRGPPVSDYSLYPSTAGVHVVSTLNQRLPVPSPSYLLVVPSIFMYTLSSFFPPLNPPLPPP